LRNGRGKSKKSRLANRAGKVMEQPRHKGFREKSRREQKGSSTKRDEKKAKSRDIISEKTTAVDWEKDWPLK